MSGRLLVIDTATRRAVVGLAEADGTLSASAAWDSAHRHGEELLPRLDRLLSEAGATVDELAAVAVGIGPGSFTGLRIGLATAKVIAYSAGCPLVGLSTTSSLAAAAGHQGHVALVLPAGTADRYVARYETTAAGARELAAPRLLPAQQVPSAIERGDLLLAVDLPDDELGASAADLGRQAQAGLAVAMARSAAAALAAGDLADLARLVPSYVAIPRGVASAAQEVAWSPDLR